MTSNKSTKKLSTREIGKLHVQAVEDWLSKSPSIPQYQNKANQAAIGRMFGITKSTWNSNPKLKALWERVNEEFALHNPTDVTSVKASQLQEDGDTALLHQKDEQINQLKKELIHIKARSELLRQNLAAEELLILTGRYLPYNPLEDDNESFGETSGETRE
jgi:hypothetical protein